jgi:hypothetical protein
MSKETFNHTYRTEAVMTVVADRTCRQRVLAGGAWLASPALVRSRI